MTELNIISLEDRKKIEQEMTTKEHALHDINIAQTTMVECMELLREYTMQHTFPAISMHNDLGLKLNYADSLIRQAQDNLKT